MSLLRIESATLGYGTHVVVSDLNLAVGEGEIVALLGRNGAGKTTTLNGVSGLIPAQAGTVAIFGEPVDARRPHRNAVRGVGHVAEGRCLFSQMTVAENLRTAGARRRSSGNLAYDMFPPLQKLANRKAGLLSGGEQQMLVIGRALLLEPRLLLVDELSLGLAGGVARHILGQLRVIAKDMGVGVLLVEQYVHLALETADRAYVLSSGRVALEGSTAELRDRFDEVRAAYLGEEETDPA